VQIHGGGYVFSSKLRAPTPAFFPDGLLAHGNENHEEMIYVALNYRLGALGFLPVEAGAGAFLYSLCILLSTRQ
jgi:carboxylesterase type B